MKEKKKKTAALRNTSSLHSCYNLHIQRPTKQTHKLQSLCHNVCQQLPSATLFLKSYTHKKRGLVTKSGSSPYIRNIPKNNYNDRYTLCAKETSSQDNSHYCHVHRRTPLRDKTRRSSLQPVPIYITILSLVQSTIH